MAKLNPFVNEKKIQLKKKENVNKCISLRIIFKNILCKNNKLINFFKNYFYISYKNSDKNLLI